MSLLRTAARPLLASVFVYSGADVFRNPDSRGPKAEAVAPSIAATLGLPPDTRQLVQVNAATHVVAGFTLGLGLLPRFLALVLSASLVPTTAAGHAFWEEQDAATRAQQRIHFLKNTAILGGLLYVVS